MKKRLTLLLTTFLTVCLSANAQNNKTIVSEGWDTSSAKETWTENDVTWSIDWVEEYTDGSRERTSFTTSDRRKLTVLTDWAVLGGFDYKVLTEAPEVEVTACSEKSKVNTAGVRFQWVREKRKITTRGSYRRIVLADTYPSPFPTEEQTNEWETIDPFDCKVTYRGQSYSFPRKEVSVSHSILDHSSNSKYDIKNDGLLYTIGDNTISAVAFGVLHCEASFFPTKWGFLYEAKQTVAPTKNHNGFVYVWSLHFSEGYVLPVIVAPGSVTPDWDFSYCEKTDETAYNSAYYNEISKKWVNTVASDGDGGMYWSRGGAIVDYISDKDAHDCNWDEGHGISVHTNRYEITFPNMGRIKAVDTYKNRNMGTWDGIEDLDVDQHMKFNLRISFGSSGGKVLYNGQEVKSLKDFNIESEGPKPVTIQIVPDEGYMFKSVLRDNLDATHYVVDNVLSFTSLSYNTSLRFAFEQGEATPPDEPDPQNPEEPQEPEEYVEYNDGILTFYYDDQRNNRTGKTYDLYESKMSVDGYTIPIWYDHSDYVTKAVFDASFANVTPTTTSCWFYRLGKLQEVVGISNLNTSQVKDMSRMFYYCNSLGSLNLRPLDTSNVTDMTEMFDNAGSTGFELDVSGFNTGKVTSMRQMFNACSAVSLNLTSFDTSNVTDMYEMFKGTSLTYLDLSSFDTHQVKDMVRMFDTGEFEEIVFGQQYVSSLSTMCDLAFWLDTGKLKTVTYTGDIPESIHHTFYDHVGTQSNPAKLNVPEEYKEHYKAKFDGQKFYGGYFTLGDEGSDSSTDPATEPTDSVTLMANSYSRQYGEDNPTCEYTVVSGKLESGTPTITCAATKTSPVGTYDIIIEKGSVSNKFVTLVNGTLTITKAPLTISVGDYSKEEGEPNPSFMPSYSGFKNGENSSVLTKQPTISCSATTSSAPGTYPITVSGAEAQNYDITYNNGTLTITAKQTPPAGGSNPYVVYDDGTLTFYCDSLRSSRQGTTYDLNSGYRLYPGWYEHSGSIIKAVFDASFADARPTTTFSWFYGCSSLTEIEGMGYLNTSEVLYMVYMFRDCDRLKSLELSNFDTKNVVLMSRMFHGCSSLTNLDVTSFDTRNVTDMWCMFYGCKSLTSLDLSNFDTRNVTKMYGMFQNCINLKTIYANEVIWNTGNVTEGDLMFSQCTNLVGGNGTQYDKEHTNVEYARIDKINAPGYLTNKDYNNPPAGNSEPYVVYNTHTLTFYCDDQRSSRQGTIYSLNEGENEPDWVQDNNNRNVEKVVFDASFAKAHPTSTSQWFLDCDYLTEIRGIEYLNTSEVKSMRAMFRSCKRLKSVDVSHFDTRAAENIAAMFSGCSSLESIDVSHFDTNNVYAILAMFYNCKSLKEIDLSSFNTSKVLSMTSLFEGCSNLTTLYLGSEFTSTDDVGCDDVFVGCQSLGKVVFTGDIPSSINSKFFEGVGTADAPATLDVPDAYKANYLAKFDGVMFYSGYFKLVSETGINDVSIDGQIFDVYSLSGTIVKKRATSLESLPKGAYIVNSQKVVVK